jgi:hypothetical protein
MKKKGSNTKLSKGQRLRWAPLTSRTAEINLSEISLHRRVVRLTSEKSFVGRVVGDKKSLLVP